MFGQCDFIRILITDKLYVYMYVLVNVVIPLSDIEF